MLKITKPQNNKLVKRGKYRITITANQNFVVAADDDDAVVVAIVCALRTSFSVF